MPAALRRPGATPGSPPALPAPPDPVPRGSIVSVYGTGGGLTTPPFQDGQIAPGPAPLALAYGLSVLISGSGGEVLSIPYAGAAPMLVNGVMQINVQVPMSAQIGPAVQPKRSRIQDLSWRS
jgi:uncharacterized protein (TIGR03437 family)